MQTSFAVKERNAKSLGLIEAALYVSGRPLDVKALGSLLRARSEERIRGLARALMERYRESRSSIEILELHDGRYVMQLRPDYVGNVKKFSQRQLLTPGPLKTLSFIAIKQPVTQAYVVRVRGKLTYGYVKQLKELGLIHEERLGRSKILRTTANFADYFNLSQETRTMKKQLEKFFRNFPSKKQGKSERAD